MIAAEYYDILKEIQISNKVVISSQPPSSYIEIDLNSRSFVLPSEFKDFLSVEKDHRAETIYFRVNRFHDVNDLGKIACVIEYINAVGESRIYPVIWKCVTDQFVYIAWHIGGEATKAAGKIQFAVRFFSVNPNYKTLNYNLSIQPMTSQILYGMRPYGEMSDPDGDGTGEIIENEYNYPSDDLEAIWSAITDLQNKKVEWIDL